MTCNVCDIQIGSTASNVTLCSQCENCNQTERFAQMLTNLQEIEPNNQGYQVLKDKCRSLELAIKGYPPPKISPCIFNPYNHDPDRTAIKYIKEYGQLKENDNLHNYLPVTISAFENDRFYKTFAMLCGWDIETGSKELRVRNIIDMAINAESYRSNVCKSRSCLELDDTWKDFLMELIRENPSINGPNAFYTIVLASMANIVGADIRSIYLDVPGHNQGLRKQFHRTFSPFNKSLATNSMSTINILWANTKDPCQSTNGIWVSNCMVPLVLKPDCYRTNTTSSPTTGITTQNPPIPERCFYRLSCHCLISQNGLDTFVPVADQQKRQEAKERGENTTPLNFSCPMCSRICHDYYYDLSAVTLFRQHFTGARLIYVLVDQTYSMQSKSSSVRKIDRKSSLPRFGLTKVAIKQLLREIAADAGPSDKAIVAIFDEKLQNPALIDLCNAANIAQEFNFNRIDALELSPRSVKTNFYSVLTQVYEMLAQQSYLYIDLYLFSDGMDTSNKKNERKHQAIIRRLNEQIGAKCHFMNIGSTPQGGFVADWLGDPEVNCSLAGGKDEIERQVAAAFRQHHIMNPNLPSRNLRANPLNEATPSANNYMTDAEVASIRRPARRHIAGHGFDENRISVDDYARNFPSATRCTHSNISYANNTNSSDAYGIVTRRKRL